jgi:hypothetical protein
MRKITLFAILIIASIGLLKSQTAFYTETFGTPTLDTPETTPGESKNEMLQNHVWDTNNVTYTWTLVDNVNPALPGSINVRNNNPSTGYTGASGVGNLYFNANATNTFTITGNTTGFNDVKLSFGIFGKAAGDAKKMVVEYSIDGGTQYTAIAATQIAALTAAAKGWELVSNIAFPTATSVKLRFSTPNLGEIRIDDVKLAGTAISNHLSNPNLKYWSLEGKTLKFEEFAISNIELYNLTGTKVAAFKPAREIKLELKQGIYILKVDGKATKITIR